MKHLLLFLMMPFCLLAQDDLVEALEQEVEMDKTVDAAFKGLKVVNFESTKLAHKKEFYFIVAHRFGTVKNGIEDFFGLDQAVTQLKFIYGINDWLNVGVARSSFLKKYGVHIKYRIVQQEIGVLPFTVVGYHLGTVNTALDEDLYTNLEFSDRLTYTSQLLLSRKFSEKFSLLLAPTYIHENLATRSVTITESEPIFYDERNDQFAVGIGGRYKLAKRWSVNLDYGLHLNRNGNSSFKNPLSIGVDLETGGHVFQMHFTNAQAMFEEGYLIRAQGDWSEGDFYFGFNLSRVF
ncbi:DUF5777 family beta-barrel protein [Luteirhabdus pelagi]|uniref:DUF5777 family beta-barrel protein n=1 Tax=Luteirhabdus pelagi TaxID=2792783 RepID=UPI00193A8CE8|nr:DUF5777 family beta-barrel protein [Luteirhabdus pelagi]